MTIGSDKVFAGSVPELYDKFMVPLLFEPYAEDMAARLAGRMPKRVLEIAAGTGAVTRELAATLPVGSQLVATDLNQAMLDQAAARGTDRPVEWRQADAMKLPFADGEFDAVACQFGVMFLPDKAKGFSEALRVLRPGGVFVFNVWDRIEVNEFADEVTRAVGKLFPEDPPLFLKRTPHGYHDIATVERDLSMGGFTRKPAVHTLPARSRAKDARTPSVAYCQGTPMRNEITARDASRLEEATEAGAKAVEAKFGPGPVDGLIQAHVFVVVK